MGILNVGAVPRIVEDDRIPWLGLVNQMTAKGIQNCLPRRGSDNFLGRKIEGRLGNDRDVLRIETIAMYE